LAVEAYGPAAPRGPCFSRPATSWGAAGTRPLPPPLWRALRGGAPRAAHAVGVDYRPGGSATTAHRRLQLTKPQRAGAERLSTHAVDAPAASLGQRLLARHDTLRGGEPSRWFALAELADAEVTYTICGPSAVPELTSWYRPTVSAYDRFLRGSVRTGHRTPRRWTTAKPHQFLDPPVGLPRELFHLVCRAY
jgi:hypothetical protein